MSKWLKYVLVKKLKVNIYLIKVLCGRCLKTTIAASISSSRPACNLMCFNGATLNLNLCKCECKFLINWFERTNKITYKIMFKVMVFLQGFYVNR